VRELLEQLEEQKIQIDAICCVAGSGGMACGIGLGLALSGSPIKLHAFSVACGKSYFHREINRMLNELGAPYR